MVFLRNILPISLALSACVQIGPTPAPLVANVSGDGAGCRVTVNRQRVTQRQLLEIARKSPERRGIVVYNDGTPFKCLGAAIITMQQAGLRSVDVASWDGS